MPVKVMILAAGRGERMRPLTDNCPKPLLDVAGKPLIEYHLEKLVKAGVKEVVINLAYLGEQIKARLEDGERWGLSIHYSHEAQALETAGGIAAALEYLGPEPFWVINGDIWTDWDYETLFEYKLEEGRQGHLILVENPNHNPQGDFDLEAGRVINRPRWTFAGAALYAPELFSAIPQGKHPLREVFVSAITQESLSGEVKAGYWCDVGTPERLDSLNEKLKRLRT